MQQAEQIRQGRKLLSYMDERSTAMAEAIYRNPVNEYIDRDVAANERRTLFRQYPINLGLSCRVPNPGDFFTDDYTGVPILVTRDRDGDVHAMINSCRHRGARVASGNGSDQRSFVCPYHAWSYGLDGALMARPHDAAFASLDKADCSLVRLPVEERHGMIWVVPTPGAPIDVDAHLGGLAEDLAAYGLDTYHHYETRELKRRMNWKLVVDTFLETYHINVLHRKTIHPILHSDLATFDGYNENLRLIAPRRTIDELREQPEAEWDLFTHTAIVSILFPNTVFIMQRDHVETWHVFPDGDDPDCARMFVSLYTPEPAETDSARGHWDRNFDLLLRTVCDEDFPLGEGVQAGFHSGGQSEIVFGRNEPALQHYHRNLTSATNAAAG